MREFADNLLVAQGGYYLALGLWPILSMRSFEWVTGPKKDRWLVKTVGALIVAVAVPLLMTGRRGLVDADSLALALGAAAALCMADIVYTLKGVISPVYMLEAFIEAALIVGYIFAALDT